MVSIKVEGQRFSCAKSDVQDLRNCIAYVWMVGGVRYTPRRKFCVCSFRDDIEGTMYGIERVDSDRDCIALTRKGFQEFMASLDLM